MYMVLNYLTIKNNIVLVKMQEVI